MPNGTYSRRLAASVEDATIESVLSSDIKN